MRAIAGHDAGSIERLFFNEQNAPLFGQACKVLAEKRRTYRLVKDDELKKITDTAHHQGVAAVISPRTARPLAELKLTQHTLCLYDVLNPHNVGAIIRTAAFFGVRDVLVSGATHAAGMTAAAWRVAEGGMTHMRFFVVPGGAELDGAARKAHWVTAAALRPEKNSLPDLEEITASAGSKPVIVCLGNEESGLPAAFVAKVQKKFTIAGSGLVESLNVSVAAALCLEKLGRAR